MRRYYISTATGESTYERPSNPAAVLAEGSNGVSDIANTTEPRERDELAKLRVSLPIQNPDGIGLDILDNATVFKVKRRSLSKQGILSGMRVVRHSLGWNPAHIIRMPLRVICRSKLKVSAR